MRWHKLLRNILGCYIGLNVIGPLPPTKRGHHYILVMVDNFTKAVEANFESAVFQSVRHLLGATKAHNTQGHPQGNG